MRYFRTSTTQRTQRKGIKNTTPSYYDSYSLSRGTPAVARQDGGGL